MEKYVVLFCIAALSAWKMHEAMRRNRHTRAILWLLSLALPCACCRRFCSTASNLYLSSRDADFLPHRLLGAPEWP